VPSISIGRRSLLATALVTAAASTACAQTAPEVIELWPSAPPGGPVATGPEQRSPKGSVTHVSRPRLIAYRPAHPNGTAAVVISGGGYAHIEAGTESTPACRWLQSSGTTAFELIYRLPEDGWSPLAPFQDAQRALRIVRSRAAAYGIDAARIGVIGFSAGGHLAGMTAVQPAAPRYPPVDAADAISARPDFAGLIYPVLTMMPPFDNTHSRREIVGLHPSDADSAAWSVERHVDAQTPPTFLAQAADDPISPIDNSLLMFGALRAAHVPAELHVFQSGGHGWGMGHPDSETRAWPALFAAWARRNAFLPAPAGNP
jgi:acetyl esterase/lipase